MIALFGKLSLWIAYFFALLQAFLPLLGYKLNNKYLMALATPNAFLQFFFILIAYCLLMSAFIINEFSITYVLQNSFQHLPLLYRISAVWGGHEGSILLWILFLNIWTVIVFFYLRVLKIHYTYRTVVVSLLGCLSFCLLTFLIFTSNPFQTHAAQLAPFDLNPLLQDPGFIIHPPMLYMGYVGLSISFAMIMAACLVESWPRDIIRLTRHLTLMAWSFLTLGITLGSWWAYRVLGWGGFWFWDPVENASLLPWISATALIHLLILSEKSALVKAYTALIGIITFAMSLLGTFLVRSGILISSHTFANDPKRGVFLLVILSVVMLAALVIYRKGIKNWQSSPRQFALFTREMGLLTNSGLLLTTMCTILLGTLYPLIFDALHLGAISVGAPYFNTVMLPLVSLILFTMGVTVFFNWQTNPKQKKWQQIQLFLILSVVTACIILFFIQRLNVSAWLILTLSIFVLLSLKKSNLYFNGMMIAHGGFAILMIGILMASLLSETKAVRLLPNQQTVLGPYHFHFKKIKEATGANFKALKASFVITKNNRYIATLHPEKRFYEVRQSIMTKVSIHGSLFRDLYLALGEPFEDGSWSLRLYYKPFISFIWLGGIMMMLGGLLCCFKRMKESA